MAHMISLRADHIRETRSQQHHIESKAEKKHLPLCCLNNLTGLVLSVQTCVSHISHRMLKSPDDGVQDQFELSWGNR